MKASLFGAGWFMLCGLLMFAAACSDDELQQLKGDIAAVHRQLAESQAENRKLLKENSELQSNYQALDAFCENLQVEKKELTQWSRELVSLYGPSVWYIGPYEKPLPRKRYQTATAKDLLRELNRVLRQDHLPEVVLTKIDDRTAYVAVSDDAYLTQKMGSAGAAAYLNAVTFTLCSLDAIQCVDFDFEAGDHAAPERLCR